MIAKKKPRGRGFTSENQPENRGRKAGKKIGRIEIYKVLEKETGYNIDDATLLTNKQYLELVSFLVLNDTEKLIELAKDKKIPSIIRMIADELINTKQPLDTIYKLFDRLTKMQGIESEPLQLNYLIRNIKEVQDAEN